MTISDFLLDTADVTTDTDGQIHSTTYDDIYHSANQGPAEKDYVFLQKNALQQRWTELPPGESGTFTIAETGFGTGLNFLLTANLWQDTCPEDWTLHFLSIEKHPLHKYDFEKCLAGWVKDRPELEPIARRLISGYPAPVKGHHRIWLAPNICLTLLYGDVLQVLGEITAEVDVWYLDGFDPGKNPAMWDNSLWPFIDRLSKPDTTISSYTVAGSVRRGLAKANFQVSKVPGFGTKRQQLIASRNPELKKPLQFTNTKSHKNIAIIGGGLAGTTCAHLLALRGIPTTLFESNDQLATAASGMYQLAYYPQLSASWDPFTSFSLQAFQYLNNYLQIDDLKMVPGGYRSGFLKLFDEPSSNYQRVVRQFEKCPEVIRIVSAAEATSIAGIPLSKGGLYYPQAGWMDPYSLSRTQCLQSDLLSIEFNHCISEIKSATNGWELFNSAGIQSGQFTDVIITTGIYSRSLEVLADLPLTPVRGQTAVLETNDFLSSLKVVLADSIGLFPAMVGQHGLSATYNHDNDEPKVSSTDHAWLMQGIAATFPGQPQPPEQWKASESRVGIRCVARDRHPIAGLVSDPTELRAHYAPLARNARQQLPAFSGSRQGLYVCTAFGSHGLSHIPLCADHIVSLISGEPSPLTADSRAVVDPDRFLIRDMKKQSLL